MTRRSSRFATRNAPGSTSLLTARCAAKATRTASPPRSKASTSIIRARSAARSGHPNPVPRVTGKIRRKHPVEVQRRRVPAANTDRAIKITVPGPFTMAQQAQNDHYQAEEEMVARLCGGGERGDQGSVCGRARISSRSMSRGCRRGRKRRVSIGIAALNRALEG